MDELYLDNIDEYVHDHNKIVTYKWLSVTLGVHVNTAKQMLYHYLDHKRKESSAPLHATYLVSGRFEDNGQTSHRVSLVREDQVEDVKSKMSLIASVHVYSVQKALLKDSSTLYSVDYDAVKDNLKNCSRFSAIRCASAVPMSSVELQQVREMQRPPSPEPESKKSSMNGEAQKPSTKSQKGIMGMFANKPTSKTQDSSKEIKSGPKDDTPEADATKSKPAGKANPMSNFFGTQLSKKPDKTIKVEEAAQSPTAEQKPQTSSQPEEKQEAAVETQKDTKKDSRSKTKRIQDSDSEEEKMEKKKRRRIKKPEPDSSDEDVIPDSPQQVETSLKKTAKTVSYSQQVHSEIKTRKRRRVLKHHTFQDEEGCIVTEKVYESESYSETEDDAQPTKQAPKDVGAAKLPASQKDDEKKSQKKASANANKGSKQASIMGFFQKK